MLTKFFRIIIMTVHETNIIFLWKKYFLIGIVIMDSIMDTLFKLQYDCVDYVVTARFTGSIMVVKAVVYTYCNTRRTKCRC